MIIGRMNWRITLLQPVKTPDGMGGSKTTYQSAGKVWAEFRNPNIKEMTAVGTVVSDLIRLISVRRRTDIQRGWRVQNDSRTYDVLHTYDMDLETTIIICRELVT
jgi:SPP1 family predicted phage head-tail adaptor